MTQNERTQVAGYGRSLSGKAVAAERKAQSKETKVDFGIIENGAYVKLSRKIESSSRSEALRQTNPNYYTDEDKWTKNCQKCAPTYDAIRKGYNVTAKPYGGKNIETLSSMDEKTGVPSVYKNPKVIHIVETTPEKARKAIEEQMVEWGDGARAIIRIKWNTEASGHIFISEQENGKTLYLDPQSDDDDVSRYFSFITPEKTCIMRIDDLEFTDRINECCEENKENDNSPKSV